ncbi:hypothetical protein [Flavobacterium sp.]|nr:hypothetical protein [Flavobacterium sp.]
MTEDEKRKLQELKRITDQAEKQRLERERQKIELNEQIKKGIGSDNRPKK